MTAPGATALAALPDDDFNALVRASIGREADSAVWDALTDPTVIARTKVALAALHSDVENQLSLATSHARLAGTAGKQAYFDARGEAAEWRYKALGFRRLVQQRLALVKSRTPRPEQRPAGTGELRRHAVRALESLARAVAAHRDRVLSGEGSEEDDDTLWASLEEITMLSRKGEQPLTDWLTYLDEARADTEGAGE